LNLGELTEEARDRAIDKASSVTDAKAQIIARLLVKDLIIRTGGWWLYDEYTFTSVASTGSYAFPSRLMKPLLLLNTSQNNVIEQEHWRIEGDDIDRSQTGTPRAYSYTYLRGVQNQPTSASKVTIASSSASDTAANGHYVRLRGLDSNYVEVRETLSMNGTTDVISGNTYLEVWSLDKGTNVTIASNESTRYFSNGQYTATTNAAAVTLAVIGAEESRREFQWFRFFPVCDSADDYRLHFLRKPSEVSTSYDRIDIPDFLETAALLYLEWYVKAYLLDQRDDKTFQFYVEQLAEAEHFLKDLPGQRIIHGEIDSTRGGLYQPPAGYISRRA